MCKCTEGLSRREAMAAVAAAAAAFAMGPIPFGWTPAARADESAASAPAKPRKVLFYTRSQGFEHSCIKRPDNNSDKELSHAEKVLVEMGKKHGFKVTATKDGGIFTPEKLKDFDVIAFYTTLNLEAPGGDGTPPMPPGGKELLLKWIADGKGFVGFHCASDTFHSGEKVDPYIRMLGGEFAGHGGQQPSRLLAVSKTFPIAPEFLKDVDFPDEEWYEFRNFNPDMHVILVQDTQSMREESYKKQPNYPMTWARRQGKGRVFYTSMGHREDVWTNPLFQGIVLGGLSWAAGNVEAEVPTNFKEVTPGAMERAIKE